MKYLKATSLIVGILLLSNEIYSQGNSVTLLKTENGRDYYLISVEMNVRKSYHDLDFNPYPDKLGDNRLTRRRMTAVVSCSDARFDSIMMYDAHNGAKRPYVVDGKPFKSTSHVGLKNPSGHEAALYLIKTESKELRIDLFLGNWKHNWNRFNRLEIIYSVPENKEKVCFAMAKVSAQMPSEEIIIGFGPIPLFSF